MLVGIPVLQTRLGRLELREYLQASLFRLHLQRDHTWSGYQRSRRRSLKQPSCAPDVLGGNCLCHFCQTLWQHRHLASQHRLYWELKMSRVPEPVLHPIDHWPWPVPGGSGLAFAAVERPHG